MKRLQKLMIVGLLAGPMIFFGCQKSDVVEPVQTPADDLTDNTNIDNKEYCGNTMTYTLGSGFDQQNLDFGSVTISNDETNLFFDFNIDELNGNGYFIYNTYIFVINAGVTPDLGPFSGGYVADVWNGDGTGHFFVQNFPFITGGLNTKDRQEIITFAQLEAAGITTDCMDIVAAAKIYNVGLGEVEYVFAKPTLKYEAWYVNFCIEPCEEDCETVYAYGGEELADCFIPWAGSNWGWTNGPISDGYYGEWDIYAGAGQCDITKGTLVGMLLVDYSDGYVKITYDIDTEYTLNETHLHIGTSLETRLPKLNGNFVTAPGQYTYSGGDYFEIPATGDIWITAHGVVCGDFD